MARDPEAIKRAKRKYSETHRDQIRERRKGYNINKEARRIAGRRRYAAKREYFKKYKHDWRKDNKERVAAQNKEQYSKHRDKRIASVRRWACTERGIALRRANKRRYYQRHRLEIIEKEKARYRKDPERGRQRTRDWKKANHERSLDNNRKFYASNKERYFAHSRTRRARVKNAPGTHTAEDVDLLFQKQRGRCAMLNCRAKITKSGKKKFHVDHVQALSKGGSNWPDNIQLLCADCNLRKKAKDPYEWANENGLLFC